jgi:hypothetical protein
LSSSGQDNCRRPLWEELAEQSHWHFIFVGLNDRLVDVKEFVNTFLLIQTLTSAVSACQGLQLQSFDQAKDEFCDTYSVTDLLRL